LPPTAQEEIQNPSQESENNASSSLFQIISPLNGSFISLPFYISLKNDSVIKILNIYWNNELIKTIEDYKPQESIILDLLPEKIETQNKLIIEAKNNDLIQKEELIIYK